MFSKNPNDLRDPRAQEVADAVGAGNWQVPQYFSGTTTTDVLVEVNGTIYSGSRNADGSVDIPLNSFEWLTVELSGNGRTDIQAEMDRREALAAWASAEMERDPEGAFGGHGNNV